MSNIWNRNGIIRVRFSVEAKESPKRVDMTPLARAEGLKSLQSAPKRTKRALWDSNPQPFDSAHKVEVKHAKELRQAAAGQGPAEAFPASIIRSAGTPGFRFWQNLRKKSHRESDFNKSVAKDRIYAKFCE